MMSPPTLNIATGPEVYEIPRPDRKETKAVPAPPGRDATQEPPPDRRVFLEYYPPLASNVPCVWEYPENDDGRAACYLAHFGKILRYCPEIDRWRVWHGHRWHDDTTGRCGFFSQLLSRFEITKADRFALENDGDKDKMKLARRLRNRASALGNERGISAMLAAASRAPHLVVPLGEWDGNPWLVGVQNGVIDLRTRTLHSGRPEDHITKSLAVDFDTAADCPTWRKFIARILPAELGSYVQRIAGYALTGNVDDGAFYFCHGSGKNGKSILIETLARIFGDYAGHARAELIEEPKHGGSPKHDLAKLPGVRFLHSEETSDGARFRSGTIKSLATGERLTGEQKYCTPFEFTPTAKLWIGGNHRPRLDGADFGFTRRIRLIPFLTKITPEEEIPRERLLASLQNEASGILNWMLEGLAQWRPGLQHAAAEVRQSSAEYVKSEDEIGDFIDQCTQEASDDWKGTTKAVAYAAYQRWAALEGNAHPLRLKTFTRRLGDKGWSLDKGRRYWRGKSIRHEEEWG